MAADLDRAVSTQSTGGRWRLAAVGLLVWLLAACGGSDGGCANTGGPPADHTVKMTMLDTMKFVPDSFTVKAGQTVCVDLTNMGVLIHDFVIREGGETRVELSGGKQGLVVFTAPPVPGEYEFACIVPGHQEAGMKGVMRVVA
jgi:uncharacterized cupredoxin-like copper-binding protein